MTEENLEITSNAADEIVDELTDKNKTFGTKADYHDNMYPIKLKYTVKNPEIIPIYSHSFVTLPLGKRDL